jgi:hypothetical protein
MATAVLTTQLTLTPGSSQSRGTWKSDQNWALIATSSWSSLSIVLIVESGAIAFGVPALQWTDGQGNLIAGPPGVYYSIGTDGTSNSNPQLTIWNWSNTNSNSEPALAHLVVNAVYTSNGQTYHYSCPDPTIVNTDVGTA